MKKINDDDYPCYHEDASQQSMDSQRKYKQLIWSILLLMIVSTAMQSVPNVFDNRVKGIIVFLGLIGTVLMMIFQPDKSWYIGRAIAESIKTLSWRYMMRSQPFDGLRVDDRFIQRCSEILNAAIKNEGFIHKPTCKHSQIITDTMRGIRNLPFDERKAVYLEERIKDQISWYQAKSKFNGKRATISLIVVGVCQLLALLFLIFLGDSEFDITSVLIVIATTAISIMEMNKYRELERSYSFTAFELNNIKNRFGLINNNDDLDIFVEEAEQAISREHT
ncbi:MAG: DUF4231 domain-containing protein, partial [Flavobacterium sp.]